MDGAVDCMTERPKDGKTGRLKELWRSWNRIVLKLYFIGYADFIAAVKVSAAPVV
jgi:hypothetical protein